MSLFTEVQLINFRTEHTRFQELNVARQLPFCEGTISVSRCASGTFHDSCNFAVLYFPLNDCIMIASQWSGQIRLLAKQKSNTCKMHQIAQFLTNSTRCILKFGPSFIKIDNQTKS